MPNQRQRSSRRTGELLIVAHRNGLRLLKLVNTLLDFTRIEAGRVEARYEPTDLANYTAEFGERVPLGHREGRDASSHRLLASLRTCLHRPGNVGEDRSQPALQCLQVYPGRRDRRYAAGTGRSILFSVRDTGTEIIPEQLPAFLSGFTASKARAPAPMREPVSGWPWCRNWSNCTEGPSAWKVRLAREPHSRFRCHREKPTCLRIGSPPQSRLPRRHYEPTPCRGGAALASRRRPCRCVFSPSRNGSPLSSQPARNKPGAYCPCRRQYRYARVCAPPAVASL